MEAKLIVLASASEEVNWLRDLLFQISYFEKSIHPILIHCDSNAAIGRIQNCYYNGKSRPIRRKHSNVRSYLTNGTNNVDYVKSCNNLANPLTKSLTREKVWSTLRRMGLKPTILESYMRKPNMGTRDPITRFKGKNLSYDDLL